MVISVSLNPSYAELPSWYAQRSLNASHSVKSGLKSATLTTR